MLLVLLAPLVSRWLAHGHVAAAVPMAAMDHSQHAQHAMEGHHGHHAMAMQQGEVAKKPPADPHAEHEMGRSEEHTSELQSQSNLVCRLLLEKKKTKNSQNPANT